MKIVLSQLVVAVANCKIVLSQVVAIWRVPRAAPSPHLSKAAMEPTDLACFFARAFGLVRESMQLLGKVIWRTIVSGGVRGLRNAENLATDRP